MQVEKSAQPSKWVAGAGTTALGIIGTVLGGYAALSNGNGSGLPGLGGSTNMAAKENSELRSQVAQLTAQKYTDTAILNERDRHLEWVKQLASVDATLAAMDDKVEKMAINNAADIAALKQNIALQNTIDNQKAQIDMLNLDNKLSGQISQVAAVANQGIAVNANNIAALTTTVSNLTKVVIPQSNVCNTGCGCNQQ